MIYAFKPVGYSGPVKIGSSAFPETRLLAFAHWSPIPLEMVFSIEGTMIEERRIHAHLSEEYSHGEWFGPGPMTESLVQHVRETGELPELVMPSGPIMSLFDHARYDDMKARRSKGETLQKIGDAYGISRERVRQILAAGTESTDMRQIILDRRHEKAVSIEKKALEAGIKPVDLCRTAKVNTTMWARWKGGMGHMSEKTLTRLEAALDEMVA